jgi:dTDP-4-dehydrorhamnose 3,5-epimerase
MKFVETDISGVVVIELEKHEDERGWFARAWCREKFAAHDLPIDLVECNLSYNEKRGTLRGMHFQVAPYAEAKLVRCVSGSAHDVALDLRPESPSYRKSIGFELSADSGRSLFLPEGIAHGFQTLVDHSTLFYQMSSAYSPEAAAGVRWDDPAFGIEWPLADPIVSERDQAFPDFTG